MAAVSGFAHQQSVAEVDLLSSKLRQHRAVCIHNVRCHGAGLSATARALAEQLPGTHLGLIRNLPAGNAMNGFANTLLATAPPFRATGGVTWPAQTRCTLETP